MAEKPFIVKFTSGDQHYIYDVNSNHIVNVDEAVFSVIDYWKASSLRVAQQELSATPRDQVRRAWREIGEFARRGFFSSFRPRGIRFGTTFPYIRKLLDTSLEQIVLCVTEKCNLRCAYCVYSGNYTYRRAHSQREMSRDVAFKAVDYFLQHSSESKGIAVGFYGGEPFLNFALMEAVIQYARAKEPGDRLRLNLTTNLTILSEPMLQFMVANNVGMLVSLDGAQNVHDRYRVFQNGKGSHDQVMRNLQRIYEYDREYFDRKVTFNMVLAPPCRVTKLHDFINETELLKKAHFTADDVDDRETGILQRFPKNDRIITDYGELENRFTEQVTRHGQMGSSFLQTIVGGGLLKIYKRQIGYKTPRYEHPNGVCVPGLRRILVSVDGTFHICEKINESLPIGNVEDGLDFKRIQSIMQEFVDKSSPQCRNCWAVRLCSMCYIHAATDRLDFKKKEEHCEVHRKALLHNLKLYCRILEENPTALDYMESIVVS
jgi:uncharacterized protein